MSGKKSKGRPFYSVIATADGGGSDAVGFNNKRDAVSTAKALYREGWHVKIERSYEGSKKTANVPWKAKSHKHGKRTVFYQR